MSQLLSPFQIGDLHLGHRVVMAPLTRSRAEQPGDVPGSLMLQYYAQRASRGGLIITEGTTISESARGWFGAPGLYSESQVDGWRRITTAAHEKGATIFSQLWHCGRSSHISVTGSSVPVSASVDARYWQDPTRLTSTPLGWIQPSPHRALDLVEIPQIVDDYRTAALRAKRAGFDGVELHGANGYLPDQFLQNGSNKRRDIYGGSIVNRARFLLEVVEALTSVWGEHRVGVRLGPGGRWNDMTDTDPHALFDHVARELNRFSLAYLHIIEPRVSGNVVSEPGQKPVATERLRKIFSGAIVTAGGYEVDAAEKVIADGDADLVAFGRYFVSNPDLPARIEHAWPLSPYDRNSFYTFDARGYVDYPPYSPDRSHNASQSRAADPVRPEQVLVT